MARIDCSQAVNFIRESKRMCEYYRRDCESCPISIMDNGHNRPCAVAVEQYPDRAIEIVQEWSDEHQPKTRLDDILEKFPHIDLNRVDKVPYIRPFNYGYCKDCNKCTLRAKASVDTAYCWNEPVNGGATGKAVK